MNVHSLHKKFAMIIYGMADLMNTILPLLLVVASYTTVVNSSCLTCLIALRYAFLFKYTYAYEYDQQPCDARCILCGL